MEDKENIEVELIGDLDLIQNYNVIESFIKFIDEEIKKLDVGEKDD